MQEMAIFPRSPDNWRDLQTLVSQMFQEMECDVATEQRIKKARGVSDIDVLVTDRITGHPVTYLCECKWWKTRVKKETVHALRQVVTDVGAERGYLISECGFQSGATDAAKFSNVQLVTPYSLQELYKDRWLKTCTDRYVTLIRDYPDRTEAFFSATARKYGPFEQWPENARRLHERHLFVPAASCAIWERAKWTTAFPFYSTDPRGDPDNRTIIELKRVRDCVDVVIGAMKEIVAECERLVATMSSTAS